VICNILYFLTKSKILLYMLLCFSAYIYNGRQDPKIGGLTLIIKVSK